MSLRCPKSRLNCYLVHDYFSLVTLSEADLFSYCVVSFSDLFTFSGFWEGGATGGAMVECQTCVVTPCLRVSISYFDNFQSILLPFLEKKVENFQYQIDPFHWHGIKSRHFSLRRQGSLVVLQNLGRDNGNRRGRSKFEHRK